MEVPEIVRVAESDPIQALRTDEPAAKMSVQLPKLEKGERAFVLVIEFTVMAWGAEAGEKLQALALLLPEATTTGQSLLEAASTASFIAVLAPPPRDMLATR